MAGYDCDDVMRSNTKLSRILDTLDGGMGLRIVAGADETNARAIMEMESTYGKRDTPAFLFRQEIMVRTLATQERHGVAFCDKYVMLVTPSGKTSQKPVSERLREYAESCLKHASKLKPLPYCSDVERRIAYVKERKVPNRQDGMTALAHGEEQVDGWRTILYTPSATSDDRKDTILSGLPTIRESIDNAIRNSGKDKPTIDQALALSNLAYCGPVMGSLYSSTTAQCMDEYCRLKARIEKGSPKDVFDGLSLFLKTRTEVLGF